jgi:hypothetical protein
MTEYDLIYFGYVEGKDYKSVGTVPAAGVVLALWEYSQYRPIIFDDALVKKLLEKVTVHDDYLEFRFKSGVTISIEM